MYTTMTRTNLTLEKISAKGVSSLRKRMDLLVLMLLFLLPGQLSAQQDILHKQITLRFDNISLKEAFTRLEKTSGVTFAYNSSLPVLKEKVSKYYNNRTLQYILDDLLKGKDLGYKVIDRGVTIYSLKNRKNKIRISGYVYDAETGDAIITCNVYDKEGLTGTTTNRFGFYNLLLPADGKSHEVVFSFIGYKRITVAVPPHDTLVTVHLPVEENRLGAVEVKAVRNDNLATVRSAAMGISKMSAREIVALPALAGEADLMKSITVLPGIKGGADGTAGIYVRGGSIDQNLILLDGVPIYNPYHLWGFLSSFNVDAVNDVTITKGAFPARYGGRLSSVVDITMKEGNNQQWTGDVTVGLLSAKGSVSGPVVKDKASVMITARRTYADLIVVPVRQIINSGDGYKEKEGYNFTDLNTKFNYKLSDKDRLYFSGFMSRDKYYHQIKDKKDKDENGKQNDFLTSSDKGWGNVIAALRWNHLFKRKIFVNTTAYYSSYRYYSHDELELQEQQEDDLYRKNNKVEYRSDISDLAIKQDYQAIPSGKHSIRFGYGGIYHTFRPGITSFYAKTDEDTLHNDTGSLPVYAWELSAYAEDDWKATRWLRLNAGVHLSTFLVGGTSYYSLEPRLSVRFRLTPTVSLKAGYARMTQYVHLLTTSGLTQSSDLWVPATDTVKPEYSEQVSVGTAVAIGKMFLLEVEGYYKTMDNVIEYKNNTSFLQKGVTWQDKITAGKGTAYGAEFFLKKTAGRLTGSVSYTLSWSERLFEDLNFGKTFPFRYDRRHDVSLTGNYRFNDRWSLNAMWVYYSGNAVTVPTDAYVSPDYNSGGGKLSYFPSPNVIISYYYNNDIITSSPHRNNYRLPSYQRLDVTATYRKPMRRGEWNLMFGITNLYNHFNASYYTVYEKVEPSTGKVTMEYDAVSLFPIMPTVSFRIKF